MCDTTIHLRKIHELPMQSEGVIAEERRHICVADDHISYFIGVFFYRATFDICAEINFGDDLRFRIVNRPRESPKHQLHGRSEHATHRAEKALSKP